ncbi:class I SAM-dependent methyltransferase [Gilvimarinus japonicus]|jgi:2-polyprenyl-3-methyl-5-hydroxy-6-metoxy-1,4-benzoquinol methylase|uniref:Class I SAM-dependent methyltransferase n=1 Tax=Gilvimarinus japonicus TaxID=1796469 RepID=A0ABV7HP11_9GAMM
MTTDDLRSCLKDAFSRFTVKNLQNLDAARFQKNLEGRLGAIDPEIEGYSPEEIDRQRDLSIKFHWGHNHDFGSFSFEGRMGDRHFQLMEKFVSLFPVSLQSFKGQRILDVGCWTGGTTLLLCALEARQVVANEEVVKYADVVQYLADSFGLKDTVSVETTSLYDLDESVHYQRYDRVYFPGVIYHLSDPVLAFRILFNSLNIEGDILVESAGINSEEPICRFEGNYIYHNDGSSREELNRGGWNYFLPSPSALKRMMQEVGFVEVEAVWDVDTKRVFAYGKKTQQVATCKAGLSRPSVR